MEELAIKVGGVLSILLGIGHCYFYRGFGWEKEFEKISILTAKVLYTIHLFLIPWFLLFGYISWVYSAELAGGSSLGIRLTAFYTVFWFLRAIWQIIYFGPSKVKGFEVLKPLHYFLVFYFIILWGTYFYPLLKYYLV